MDLSNRTILVTGASSGIGRAAAILLSGLGARVILTARNTERLTQTLGLMAAGDHVIEPFDLKDCEAIPQWMKELAERNGPLFGLVHSAGIEESGAIHTRKPEATRRVLCINLEAAIALSSGFCLRGVRSASGGSIVFLSSVMGLVGQPRKSVYSASKAGLIGLTKSLALELARQSVRVNCIAAGLVETEMTKEMLRLLSPAQVEAIRAMHPLGFGRPEDVASAIGFLLSDDSRWITGTTLVVDGGYTAH
jgi:NAD(P)-dependent dehydrogenase (short-subunit alcohol dehydrogenase family)